MEARSEKEAPLTGLRIMVAEDELLIALDLQEIFADAGAEVIGPYATVEAALDGAAREAISVAVLDVRLGHDTIGPVAELLARRGIPFVFCSGQGLPDELHKRMPHAAVLVKPVRHQRLIEVVASLSRS